ncbi:MAG: hypothetical protein K1X94_07900 [Sandaracinaceae bacterium]|nr:hypothetical protein [Sandaracinaceae bacterium]
MVRSLALAIAALVGSLTLEACAAAAPEPTEASLELGTGTARFEPLSDGDEVPMTHGAQGGWHLWISARATGLREDFGSLEIAHGPADGSSEMQITRVGFTFDPPDAQGRRSTLGWQAILADPSCSVGRLERVVVTVTTASGQRVSAERDLLPTAGDYPPPPCTR